MTICIDQMISREVNCCLSSLVSTLALGFQHIDTTGRDAKEIRDLCKQATDLAAPVLDFEEAALQFGYEQRDWPKALGGGKVWSSDRHVPVHMRDAEEVCRHHNLEAYEWEVYEHWAVPQWLAEKLEAEGEKVDTDFAGLNVWARTTTGQQICADAVIQRIYAALVRS